MKNTIRILTLGLLLLSCSYSKKEAITKSTITKWYNGGTLHGAAVHEWKSATEENKLATCGDFMAKVDNSVTMDMLLQRATALRACINEATRGIDSMDDKGVSEIAALCTVTLGYK